MIVGRIAAVRLPFAALERELGRGLVAVHERGSSRQDATADRAGWRLRQQRRNIGAPHARVDQAEAMKPETNNYLWAIVLSVMVLFA